MDVLRPFGVADLARFMDLLAGEPNVLNGGSIVPIWNIAHSVSARSLNLAPLLRSIVFVGKPGLGKVEVFHFASRAGRTRMDSRLARLGLALTA